MREMYDEFRHYGTIISTNDHDFTKWGGNYITLQVIELEGRKVLFFLCNGEVTGYEDVK